MSLRRLLGDRLYQLQLWRDRFELRDLHVGEVVSEPPVVVLGEQDGNVVFVAAGREALSMALEAGMRRVSVTDHPRVLIGDFALAEKYLQWLLRKAAGNRLLPAVPRLVMQQRDCLEGGLTEVELRVLRELALGAGAREVLVVEGAQQLSLEQVEQAFVDQRKGAGKRASSLLSGVVTLVVLAAFAAAVLLRGGN
ncbi:MAG: rod shape-determining protein [Pseudomonadaceae bacterium]